MIFIQIEIVWALRFKSSYAFLKRPPDMWEINKAINIYIRIQFQNSRAPVDYREVSGKEERKPTTTSGAVV